MELLLGIIIGFVIATVGWVMVRVDRTKAGGGTEIEKLIAKKRENLRKIMDYLDCLLCPRLPPRAT